MRQKMKTYRIKAINPAHKNDIGEAYYIVMASKKNPIDSYALYARPMGIIRATSIVQAIPETEEYKPFLMHEDQIDLFNDHKDLFITQFLHSFKAPAPDRIY